MGNIDTHRATHEAFNRRDFAAAAFCEVLRYDAQGKVIGGEVFYDTMSMMVQLGHAQPMPAG